MSVLQLFILSVIVCASGWHNCAWEASVQTARCSSGLSDLAVDAPPAPASSQPPTRPPTFSSSPAPPYDPSCVLSLGVGAVKLFSQPVAKIDVNYFARVRVFLDLHAPHFSPLSSKLPRCIPFPLPHARVAEQFQLPWMLPAFLDCRSGNRLVAGNCMMQCDALLLVWLDNISLYSYSVFGCHY